MDKRQILSEILMEFYGISIDDELSDKSFFSKAIGLYARNLVDVVFEFEARTGKRIEEEKFLDAGISSFNGLLSAI